MTGPAGRDRTLARVRTTTAITGIGALLAGGALAGWLGHAAAADATGTSTGTTVDGSGDDGLTGPAATPTSGGTDGDQPAVVSGGS